MNDVPLNIKFDFFHTKVRHEQWQTKYEYKNLHEKLLSIYLFSWYFGNEHEILGWGLTQYCIMRIILQCNTISPSSSGDSSVMILLVETAVL